MSESGTDVSKLSTGSDDQDQPPKKIYQKKKKRRCSFEPRLVDLKYSTPDSIYQISGDIFMMRHKQDFFSEIFFMNGFKMCSNVVVKEEINQKMVHIELTDRKMILKESMNDLFASLENSKDPTSVDWYETLKNYSSVYSKVIMKQSRKKSKSDLRRKFYYKVTQETDLTREYLFRSFPCIQSKYRTKNHQVQLFEIVVSEFFIKELGYEIEEFISHILQEGFPPIMTYEDDGNSYRLKATIQNYFKIRDQDLAFEGLQSKLITKYGLAKDIVYQTHTLMNYEARTFGFDVILALTNKGEAYIDENVQQFTKVNEDFVTVMAQREEERNEFLSGYYNIEPFSKWVNFSNNPILNGLQMTKIEEERIVQKIEEEEQF